MYIVVLKTRLDTKDFSINSYVKYWLKKDIKEMH